jgi:hypothetical protein
VPCCPAGKSCNTQLQKLQHTAAKAATHSCKSCNTQLQKLQHTAAKAATHSCNNMMGAHSYNLELQRRAAI